MLWGKPNGEKGALGGVASLIASLYSVPPASGINYLTQKFHQLNPVQPAYAQPVGTQVLNPTLRLWRVFRDTTYIGFVLIFVVIGFMIMFRAHISPQAVATIQDSLPRIVIALILVTFSFAIAGLLIDIMFLFLNVAINLLSQAGLEPAGQRVAFEKNVFTVYKENWDDVFGAVSDIVEGTLKNILDLNDNPLMKIIGFTINNIAGKALGLVAGIALLFIMFKVFLMLLTSYAMILLLTIFSPFFFLMQALPGQNGAKNWLKQYVANLSVFPTVVIMLLIGGLLGELGGLGGKAGSSGFSEATVGFFPLLSGIVNTGSVAKLIGLGFLFMTPEAANLIKKFIGAQGGPGFGGAGAAALGAAGGFMGRRVSTSAPVQGVKGLAEVGREERKLGMMNRISKTFGGGEFKRGLPAPYEKVPRKPEETE